jgi:hypothetical protein
MLAAVLCGLLALYAALALSPRLQRLNRVTKAATMVLVWPLCTATCALGLWLGSSATHFPASIDECVADPARFVRALKSYSRCKIPLDAVAVSLVLRGGVDAEPGKSCHLIYP